MPGREPRLPIYGPKKAPNSPAKAKLGTKIGLPRFPKPSQLKTPPTAVKTFRDGREVCKDTPAGRVEYRMRTLAMAERQHWVCPAPDCGMTMVPREATFQHGRGRGMGGGHRDDRIDQPGNEAWHYWCNARQGSQRTV